MKKTKTIKRTRRSKRKQEFINSILFFLITVFSISGILTYLWVYNEINITSRENEALKRIRDNIIEENRVLHNDIAGLNRIDRISQIVKKELQMVSPAPESLVVFVDPELLKDFNKQ